MFSHPRFKSKKPCHFFQERGFCKKGQDCEYAHLSTSSSHSGGGAHHQSHVAPAPHTPNTSYSPAPQQLPPCLSQQFSSSSLLPPLAALSCPLLQLFAMPPLLLCLPSSSSFVFILDLSKNVFLESHVVLGHMLNEEVRKVAKVGFGVGKVGLAVAFNKRNLFSGKRIAGILLKRVLDLKDFGLDIELEVSDRGAVHILEAADGLLVAVAHDQTTGGEEYWIFNLVQDWNTDSTTLAEVLQKTAIKGSFREKVSSVDIRGNMVCFAFYSKTIAFFDLGSGESNKMNLSQVVTTDLVFSKFLPNGLLSVCSDGFIIITQDEKHLPQQHLKQEVVDCQLILEATSTLHLLLIATTSTIKLFMIVGTVTSLIATLNTQGPPTTNSQGSEKQPLARSTLFKSDTGTYLITAKYDGYMDCYRLEI